MDVSRRDLLAAVSVAGWLPIGVGASRAAQRYLDYKASGGAAFNR